jgi:hypothetical protein
MCYCTGVLPDSENCRAFCVIVDEMNSIVPTLAQQHKCAKVDVQGRTCESRCRDWVYPQSEGGSHVKLYPTSLCRYMPFSNCQLLKCNLASPCPAMSLKHPAMLTHPIWPYASPCRLSTLAQVFQSKLLIIPRTLLHLLMLNRARFPST